MKNVAIGAFLLIALGGIGWFIFHTGSSRITVHGLVSDDKEDLFANQDMKDFMDGLGIHVEDDTKSTGDIIAKGAGDHDFVILNSEVSFGRYANTGVKYRKEEVVFGTPLVLLAWDKVVDTLKANNLVTEENGILYSDFKSLLDLHQDNTAWDSLKQPNKDLYGPIRVGSANPKCSNGGKMAAMLVATVNAGPDGVTDANHAQLVPAIHQFFQKQGHMECNPKDQFNGILKKSWTLHPLTLVYENQLIEYGLANPDVWAANQKRLRYIYLKPTLWSEIHVVALTENGERFLDAMHNPKVQSIAGTRHGMRTGVGGDIQMSDLHTGMGIAPTVKYVAKLPSNTVMNQLMNALPMNTY